jgi:hypothetical protein
LAQQTTRLSLSRLKYQHSVQSGVPGTYLTTKMYSSGKILHLGRMKVQSCRYVYVTGEDRWLCTLLLQRGYRVEYSAASDAYTHCPESFDEFYNQRRRWVPSTMANIMDLLTDYKRTIKINDNISMPYIAYQVGIISLQWKCGLRYFSEF